MPKYRAKQYLLVDQRLIKPGETFASAQVPGRNWEPLDDDGKAAYGARHGEAKKAEPEAPAVAPMRAKPAANAAPVAIPGDWRDTHHMTRVSLAKQLGAPDNVRVQEADDHIAAEVERRAKAGEG